MNVLSILATVFGFIALAGGAAGYFKASRGDSIIKLQATEIDVLTGTNTRLEKDVTALNASIAAKDETIVELRRNNNYLQKIAQGSPQLKKLTVAIENQTKLINGLLSGRHADE